MDNMLGECPQGRYFICLGKASWERSIWLGLENRIKFEYEERKKSILDKDAAYLKVQRYKGRPYIKKQSSSVLPGHGIVGPALSSFQGTEGREQMKAHMKAKTSILGARDMFSLAKMLLKYLSQF